MEKENMSKEEEQEFEELAFAVDAYEKKTYPIFHTPYTRKTK
jgi:hypothetical protein